jgi:hypothetical protein
VVLVTPSSLAPDARVERHEASLFFTAAPATPPPENWQEAQTPLAFDHEAEWPPRLGGAESVAGITPTSPARAFSAREQRERIATARAHPNVSRLLRGRTEVLGCHLLHRKMRYSDGGECVRVALYDYTAGHLVNVLLVDAHVIRVELGEPWAHPESPIEMAQAIHLVASDPDHAEHVAGLEANAILRVPLNPELPGHRHRCIFLTYTRPANSGRSPGVEPELPALYTALVDLQAQRVLAGRAAPCAESQAAEA